VGISPTELSRLYPRLYHVAEDGAWASIRRNGLLSTSALLDLFGICGQERTAAEREHRPNSKRVEHAVYGCAVIRDQKPLNEAKLRKCLVGLTTAEWYQILNGKVFFWPTQRRLVNLLSAGEYAHRAHCVITVDTALLLERHAPSVRLSPINSGSTLFDAKPRGRDTFLPLEDYPFQERRKKRGTADAIAELAVEYSVPDVDEMTVRVARMKGSEEVEVIYST